MQLQLLYSKMYELLSHNSHEVTLNTIIIAIPLTYNTYIAYIIAQYRKLVRSTQSTQWSKQCVCSMSLDKNAETPQFCSDQQM